MPLAQPSDTSVQQQPNSSSPKPHWHGWNTGEVWLGSGFTKDTAGDHLLTCTPWLGISWKAKLRTPSILGLQAPPKKQTGMQTKCICARGQNMTFPPLSTSKSYWAYHSPPLSILSPDTPAPDLNNSTSSTTIPSSVLGQPHRLLSHIPHESPALLAVSTVRQ